MTVHITGPDSAYTLDEMPLYGIERVMGEDSSIPETDNTIRFKMYDDDGELTHRGYLHDDDECVNQSAALRYGETDAGATRIEVLRDGKWTQEIA